MAGIFSLGSGSGSGSGINSRETNNNNPWNSTSAGNGMILYRNEEIYQKGFEIWQQCVQFHHHNHHHSPAAAAALMGPAGSGSSSLTSSRCMMRSGLGSGGVNCQDCGNQAKKDCAHMRCRTCCKSRGFDCATHVRSTWVPAAKRRERQQRRLPSSSSQPLKIGIEGGGGGGEEDRQMIQKRQRDNYSNSTGLELGQRFPAELSSTAVFRCVRVHSSDDADEQLAYQTAINIGGRLFKGILYDQGPESHRHTPAPPPGKDSSANLMIGATSSNHPENAVAGAALLDSNALYSPPVSSFLAGTQFFPTPRS